MSELLGRGIQHFVFIIGAAFVAHVYSQGSGWNPGSRRTKILFNCGMGGVLVGTALSPAGTVCLFLGLAQNNHILIHTWIILFGFVTVIWSIATVVGSFGYFCNSTAAAAANVTSGSYTARWPMSRTSAWVAVACIFLYIGIALKASDRQR
ncbi:hypothetical protein BV898_10145 [Hypsibius exemplaris]|uniref:Uncharacterized protein n=1 Tax=Hypsibius exemplaris TaxID=2072580 RepID=A0A1W0WKG5_HYPEX|nr:hypothetical protein BV898_10145 [Hypsibius exemplaris]